MNGKKNDTIQGRLVQFTHLYFKKTFQVLKETGIHPKQAPFMALLDEKEGMSQREISKTLGISPPTVAVSVKRLEKAGLVERREDQRDQRMCRIYLTPEGRIVVSKMKTCVQRNEALVFQGFTESEKCLMKRFFDQMIANLEEDSGDVKERAH